MAHAWLEVDLDAVRHNVRVLQSRVPPTTELIAMVKGNGYGHGMVECARAALSAGATRLAVSFASEGMLLRKGGITAPVLVMGGYDPSEADLLFVHGLTPVLTELAALHDLEVRARRTGKRLPLHLHIDTGMTRLGIAPRKAPFVAANLLKTGSFVLEGCSTHFSSADEEDNGFTRIQVKRFRAAVDEIQAEGVRPGILHAANTAAILRLGSQVSFDAVRPGLGMYGLYPAGSCRVAGVELEPVLSWRARLVRVEKVPAGTFVSYSRTARTAAETRIGTVSVGYADGYPRRLARPGEASVLIGGKRYPVVGRVTMDHLMVDLGPTDPARFDDVVTLVGRDGSERITVDELAGWMGDGAIPYEVVTGLSPRLARRFTGAAAAQVPARPGLARAA